MAKRPISRQALLRLVLQMQTTSPDVDPTAEMLRCLQRAGEISRLPQPTASLYSSFNQLNEEFELFSHLDDICHRLRRYIMWKMEKWKETQRGVPHPEAAYPNGLYHLYYNGSLNRHWHQLQNPRITRWLMKELVRQERKLLHSVACLHDPPSPTDLSGSS